MKIAIASLGRFHVLDLARELDRLGYDTRFYSYVRRKRAERFGLPVRSHRGLLQFVAPLVAWQEYAGSVMPGLRERAMAHALDAAMKVRLEPCDVFICMSGMYLEAARHARRRYGAQIWLERGSRHILSQRAILARLGAARGPSDFIVERELAGYQLADRIVVPSSHVKESFAIEDAAISSKLLVNPYGVDLDQFPAQVDASSVETPTAIFVGGWSRRKGVDILVEAVRRLDRVHLLHVGSLVDAPFPHDDPRFEHIEPVPQWRLAEFYSRAHVFALASREDGFGLVLAQALAMGLPLVCTTMTGGIDLAHSPELRKRIRVTEPDDPVAFAAALMEAFASVMKTGGLPPLHETDRAQLSWEAYGRRYAEALSQSLAQTT
jgi:starch synthase